MGYNLGSFQLCLVEDPILEELLWHLQRQKVQTYRIKKEIITKNEHINIPTCQIYLITITISEASEWHKCKHISIEQLRLNPWRVGGSRETKFHITIAIQRPVDDSFIIKHSEIVDLIHTTLFYTIFVFVNKLKGNLCMNWRTLKLKRKKSTLKVQEF